MVRGGMLKAGCKELEMFENLAVEGRESLSKTDA